tara:strand:- start:1887 stop:2672 length:786 start_codon:yes stop_codon:yes gene_type:complete
MDHKDGMTAYGRLANMLWMRIAEGEWQPGDRLPTVAQLAEEYGVAPVTVRTALRMLSSQGVIHARQGRGTFVAMGARNKVEAEPFEASGLDEHYFESWIIGPSEQVKVLGKHENVSCPSGLSDGAPTYPEYVQLVRLHMSGMRPVCIVDFYIAKAAYASLPSEIENHFKIGLMLMTRSDPPIARGRQIVTVERAQSPDAALLEIAPSSPLVRVNRRFLDAEGRVVGGGVHRYPGTVFRQVIDEPVDDILEGLEHWLPSENR